MRKEKFMKGKLLWSTVFKSLAYHRGPGGIAASDARPGRGERHGDYPLGYNSSMAGFLPPPGLYLRNDLYVYQGTATKYPCPGASRAVYGGVTSWTWPT